MRKITILVLAMLLMVGTAFALDGLQIGAGLRFHDFDAPNDYNLLDPDMDMILEVIYDNRFGDTRITADIVLPIHFDDANYGLVELRFERAQYFENDLFSFITGLEAYIPMRSTNPIDLWVTPGFQFRPTFGFGNMYFRADLPLYFYGGAHMGTGLDFTISALRLRGVGFEDGFGFELGLQNNLYSVDEFLGTMTLTPYFANELLYAEVEFVLPTFTDGFDYMGIAITPEVHVNLPMVVDGLSIWLNMPIRNIGSDEILSLYGHDDPVIGLGFGVRFAF